MTTLYGISNCDTMKKARRWLDQRQIGYHFHDYRKDGLEEQALRHWVAQLGWSLLLNRRGMAWRKLDPAVREPLDEERAIALMLENPAMIKRPLLEHQGELHLGFSEELYHRLLA